MGTRLALEGGPARSSTSGRSALVAAVLGVAGVVAALTFSAGITDATDGYERFGQTAELGAFFGSGGEDFVDSAAVLGTIAADPDVDGLNDAYNDVAGGERGPVSLYTYRPGRRSDRRGGARRADAGDRLGDRARSDDRPTTRASRSATPSR